jgi:lipopolysaccharide transport system permease protein
MSEQIAPSEVASGVRPSIPGKSKQPPKTIVEATSGWAPLNLSDLWVYRELLYFLVWRNVKVKYKQTTVGALWAVLQPLLISGLFAVIFGHFAKLPSDGHPYFVFVYAGMLPWLLFATSLTESSVSLVTDKDLITKVYFPRLLVPLASVVASLVDFAIAGLALVGIMIGYGMQPHLTLVALPVFVLFAVVTALAIGIWLSALNVQYRDVQYTIPFLTQFLLFATPIAYSTTLVPERYRFVYGLNPMAGVVEGFRWTLFGSASSLQPLTIVSVAVVLVLLLTGLVYFRRTERTFADIV